MAAIFGKIIFGIYVDIKRSDGRHTKENRTAILYDIITETPASAIYAGTIQHHLCWGGSLGFSRRMKRWRFPTNNNLKKKLLAWRDRMTVVSANHRDVTTEPFDLARVQSVRLSFARRAEWVASVLYRRGRDLGWLVVSQRDRHYYI